MTAALAARVSPRDSSLHSYLLPLAARNACGFKLKFPLSVISAQGLLRREAFAKRNFRFIGGGHAPTQKT